MFDREKFSLILKNISEQYENQRDFAKKAGFDRTYISKYINMKLDKPPKPEILKKIVNSSKGAITYMELMKICGYLEENNMAKIETTDLDNAIEKAKELVNLLERAKELMKELNTPVAVTTDVLKGQIPRHTCSLSNEKLNELPSHEFPIFTTPDAKNEKNWSIYTIVF